MSIADYRKDSVNKAFKSMRLMRLMHNLRVIWSTKWVDSVVPGQLMDRNHISTQLHKFLVPKPWLRQKEIQCHYGVPRFSSASVRALREFLLIKDETEMYVLKLPTFCLFWAIVQYEFLFPESASLQC